MLIGEIKDFFKSLKKFWFFSPEAVFQTFQEIQNEKKDKNSDKKISLRQHRRYYK